MTKLTPKELDERLQKAFVFLLRELSNNHVAYMNTGDWLALNPDKTTLQHDAFNRVKPNVIQCMLKQALVNTGTEYEVPGLSHAAVVKLFFEGCRRELPKQIQAPDNQDMVYDAPPAETIAYLDS